MSEDHANYYVPTYSRLPIFAAFGLFCLVFGGINVLHSDIVLGTVVMSVGILVIAVVMFYWFREVVAEGLKGLYDTQVDRSFRWGMVWFIFSEICFFGIFFFALFYVRLISVPALAGHGTPADVLTHLLLWPNFQGAWPLLETPNPADFLGPKHVLETWGIPAINTLILLSSAVMVTWAHWALKHDARKQLTMGLIATITLGILFLYLQTNEYLTAFSNFYSLKLSSGIYGSTFFMLTGFHALHVTIGVIMLFVILMRVLKGHFTSEDHFGFEASAWYWHFVDVVWLFLFTFVYWL